MEILRQNQPKPVVFHFRVASCNAAHFKGDRVACPARVPHQNLLIMQEMETTLGFGKQRQVSNINGQHGPCEKDCQNIYIRLVAFFRNLSDDSMSPAEVHQRSEADFFSVATPLLYLQKPIKYLKSDNDERGGTNSSYEAPLVKARDVKIWQNFMANGELKQMINNPKWRCVITKPFTKKELQRLIWDEPELGGNINEMTFEILWSQIYSTLNLIHLKCRQKETGFEHPTRILIGNGDCAQKITKEPYQNYVPPKNAGSKRPDYAAYEFVPGSNQYTKHGRKSIENRVPGDAKLFRKIRRSMFPPDGAEYNKTRTREVEKVLTQIHDYMDRHEARYGYIVNDEELIFFRRRGTGWGHMDISEGIRHDTNGIGPECKISTTKLVLFYFHLVIAPHEKNWKLPSCRSMIGLRPHLPREAKGTRNIKTTGPSYKELDSDEDFEVY